MGDVAVARHRQVISHASARRQGLSRCLSPGQHHKLGIQIAKRLLVQPLSLIRGRYQLLSGTGHD
jgi:hypothetical protein